MTTFFKGKERLEFTPKNTTLPSLYSGGKKEMLITLGGKAGSGKGTISKLLSEKLTYKIVSIGDMKRKLATEMEISILEFNKLGDNPEKSEEFDLKYEEYQKNLKLSDNIILDSRLGFYCQPHAFKILLDVDEEVAAQRILNAERTSEKLFTGKKALEAITERNLTDQERYKKLYNVDLRNYKNYSLVINTSDRTPNEIIDIVIVELEKRKKKHHIKENTSPDKKKEYPETEAEKAERKKQTKKQKRRKITYLLAALIFINGMFFFYARNLRPQTPDILSYVPKNAETVTYIAPNEEMLSLLNEGKSSQEQTLLSNIQEAVIATLPAEQEIIILNTKQDQTGDITQIPDFGQKEMKEKDGYLFFSDPITLTKIQKNKNMFTAPSMNDFKFLLSQGNVISYIKNKSEQQTGSFPQESPFFIFGANIGNENNTAEGYFRFNTERKITDETFIPKFEDKIDTQTALYVETDEFLERIGRDGKEFFQLFMPSEYESFRDIANGNIAYLLSDERGNTSETLYSEEEDLYNLRPTTFSQTYPLAKVQKEDGNTKITITDEKLHEEKTIPVDTEIPYSSRALGIFYLDTKRENLPFFLSSSPQKEGFLFSNTIEHLLKEKLLQGQILATPTYIGFQTTMKNSQ